MKTKLVLVFTILMFIAFGINFVIGDDPAPSQAEQQQKADDINAMLTDMQTKLAEMNSTVNGEDLSVNLTFDSNHQITSYNFGSDVSAYMQQKIQDSTQIADTTYWRPKYEAYEANQPNNPQTTTNSIYQEPRFEEYE